MREIDFCKNSRIHILYAMEYVLQKIIFNNKLTTTGKDLLYFIPKKYLIKKITLEYK